MQDIYDKILKSKSPLIMGILNITPDSFSDGGKYFNIDNAKKYASKMIINGADIIDVGGESTRPGASSVSVNEEMDRVLPIIEYLNDNFPDITISIDTTKVSIAKEAIEHGADIINDISGGTFDDSIFELVSKYDIPYVLMHIKGTPTNMQNNPFYNDIIAEVKDYFTHQISEASNRGANKIILDPGIGFGKRVEDNFNLINNLESFKDFGYPILLGVSKKSFLGKSLNLDLEERENATIITETIGTMNGANIIRTHSVNSAYQMKKIIEFTKTTEKCVNV